MVTFDQLPSPWQSIFVDCQDLSKTKILTVKHSVKCVPVVSFYLYFQCVIIFSTNTLVAEYQLFCSFQSTWTACKNSLAYSSKGLDSLGFVLLNAFLYVCVQFYTVTFDVSVSIAFVFTRVNVTSARFSQE